MNPTYCEPQYAVVRWDLFAAHVRRCLADEATGAEAGARPKWKRAGIPRFIMWAATRGWRVPLSTFLTLHANYNIGNCIEHTPVED